MSDYLFTIDESTWHVVTSGMRFGRKPTVVRQVPGMTQIAIGQGALVLHVTGGLEYIDGGGQKYVPSRFLVFQIDKQEELPDSKRSLTVFHCSLLMQFYGIPKTPKGGA